MLRRALALAVMVGLAGCSTVQIDTQYQRGADFSKFRSFAWNPVGPGPEQASAARDPAVRQFVLATLERQLLARGLVRAAPGATPDFYVAVHGWARDRIQVRQYGYAYGHGYGAYPATVGPALEVREYKRGTILVDFIDAGTREMFWRGAATDTFVPGTGRAAIEEAIAKLLDAYPPPAR